jgi:hypothetical protein
MWTSFCTLAQCVLMFVESILSWELQLTWAKFIPFLDTVKAMKPFIKTKPKIYVRLIPLFVSPNYIFIKLFNNSNFFFLRLSSLIFLQLMLTSCQTRFSGSSKKVQSYEQYVKEENHIKTE